MTAFEDLAVPGPTTTPLSEPFWQAAEEGRLLIQRCIECGYAVFYPRPLCTNCWADALCWEEASGKGKLKSFSKILKPGHPGWASIAPFFVGLVQLTEGPTMLSTVLTGGREPSIDAPLSLTPTNVGGRILPCFSLT
ncbi:MAG: zinc ribbon domain-containing protein [Pseudomonadota bacterium]